MCASFEWSVRTRRQEERLPLRGAACLIEADDIDRENIATLLRGMGFITHETSSAAAGAFVAAQIHWDVAVISLALPDQNALLLVRHMREIAPNAVIVALSRDVSAGALITLARFAGADAVLSSPPCSEAMCATITQALEHPFPQRGELGLLGPEIGASTAT
jgi:DNA-binding NarL/FixJ family response regulator